MMAKSFIAEVVLFALMLLALASLQLVSAVDIVFWTQSNCVGSSAGCFGIAENICCTSPARASLQFRNSSGCKQGRAYRNGGCGTEVGRVTGNVCFTGGGFTGGRWVTVCRRRQLLAEVSAQELEGCVTNSPHFCAQSVDPNAVLYRDAASEGIWVIKTSEATSLLEKLDSLPDSEKVAWLKAQGATFETETQPELLSVEN